MRLMLHCSFNALFALERSRIIHEMVCPPKKKPDAQD
jgi:hypothetical protein